MSPNQSVLDIHETHEVALLVATSFSGSSISTGSPTLLNPDHDVRSSLGSSPSVKFAPLPQIDPNRKRSLAPLGVSARSRRKQAAQQEGGSLLWSTDPDVPEENLEDPIVVFARLVKKTGQALWRRVRKGTKAVPQQDTSHSAEPILDIKSTVHSGGVAQGDKGQRVLDVVGGGEGVRRASWSPPGERRALSLNAKRRSTGDVSAPPR